jgi:hypothetical protein
MRRSQRKKLAKRNEWKVLPSSAVREHAYRLRNPRLNHAVLHARSAQKDEPIGNTRRANNYAAQNAAAGRRELTKAQCRQLGRMDIRNSTHIGEDDA